MPKPRKGVGKFVRKGFEAIGGAAEAVAVRRFGKHAALDLRKFKQRRITRENFNKLKTGSLLKISFSTKSGDVEVIGRLMKNRRIAPAYVKIPGSNTFMNIRGLLMTKEETMVAWKRFFQGVKQRASISKFREVTLLERK